MHTCPYVWLYIFVYTLCLFLAVAVSIDADRLVEGAYKEGEAKPSVDLIFSGEPDQASSLSAVKRINSFVVNGSEIVCSDVSPVPDVFLSRLSMAMTNICAVSNERAWKRQSYERTIFPPTLQVRRHVLFWICRAIAKSKMLRTKPPPLPTSFGVLVYILSRYRASHLYCVLY